MRARCLNPTDSDYPDYGGRDITVCERWILFENFYADMGPRPSPRHSIDRIDVNGPYDPGNCRWALPIVQANNSRKNHRITLGDETRTLAEWERHLGFGPGRIQARLQKGWAPERALTTPLRDWGPGHPRR